MGQARKSGLLDLKLDIWKYAISPKLDLTTTARMASVNKIFYGFFQIPLQQNKALFKKLLLHVMRSESYQVEKILRIHPEFLLRKDTMIDDAGRKFMSIYALQYAAWCLDVSMCVLIKKYFPKAKIDLAYHQLKEIESGKLLWTQQHGKRYDFSKLVIALEKFKEIMAYGSQRAYWPLPWQSVAEEEYNYKDRFWRQHVFGELILVPKNIVRAAYCPCEPTINNLSKDRFDNYYYRLIHTCSDLARVMTNEVVVKFKKPLVSSPEVSL